MSRTLNELITRAVLGGEEMEESVSAPVEVQVQAPQQEGSVDLDDVGKIASALEFMGRRGIASLLDIEKAAMHGDGNVGTNAGQSHAEHVQSQVKHNKDSSPMSPSGAGLMESNAGAKPGGGSGSVDTAAQGKGSHHSALGSNEAAINYTKKEKAKQVAPALSAVLDATPFADPKLKENLSNSGTDKNIHKRAYDLASVKAELERRQAAGGA